MSAAPRPRPSLRAVALRVGLAALALLVLIQLVPYGRDHDEPAGDAGGARSTPATRAIVAEACADCHSNLHALALVHERRAGVVVRAVRRRRRAPGR